VPTVSRLTQRLVDCENGVIRFFQWNASMSKFGDQNAAVPRGNLAFGVPDGGAPNEPRRAARAIVHARPAGARRHHSEGRALR